MRWVAASLLVSGVLLAAAPAAPADVTNTTLLESRANGTGAFPPGVVNTSRIGAGGISDDGCRVAFQSEADGLAAADDDRVENIYVRDVCTHALYFVSRADGAAGAPADGDSSNPTISGDGNVVAFRSMAKNLDPAATDGDQHIFVRQLDAPNHTLLVSRQTGAGGSAAASYDQPRLDHTGNRVVFVTYASLDGADVNMSQDAYVRDVTANTTTLVSRATGAAGAPAGSVEDATISDDGLVVAFVTPNSLDANDGNALADVYTRTLASSTTTLVSRPAGAATDASGGWSPSLSADGGRVAFVTGATAAAPDTNGVRDVYVRDVAGAATTLVSVNAVGTNGGTADSVSPSISDDGTMVAFATFSYNLVADDSNWAEDVFVRDLSGAGSTTLVSRANGASGALGDSSSDYPQLSGNGTRIAFDTYARNLLSPQDGDPDFQRVAWRDLSTDTDEHVSKPTGTAPFNGDGTNASILDGGPGAVSDDGRYVTFASDSDSLSATDNDRIRNVFRRDNRTDQTTLVNVPQSGGPPSRGAWAPVISGDGRRVAFVTDANLAPDDTDGGYSRDTYVRDIPSGTTVLASRATGAGADGNTAIMDAAAISGDGSRVAFVTAAALDPADTNGTKDVYVRDLGTNTTILASRANGPGGAVANDATEPSLDEAGQRVAFTTADALAGAKDTNGKPDVYVRDLTAGTTTLASRINGADTNAGNWTSDNPALARDGERVAFESQATDLAAGSTGVNNIHVRDLVSDQTLLASRANGNGAAADNSAFDASINADGTRVAFASYATNLVNGVTGGEHAYVHDLVSGDTLVADRADGAGGAIGGIDAVSPQPSISASGNCVALSSDAPLAPAVQPAGDFAQVYMRVVSGECPDETPPDTAIDSGPSGPTADSTPTWEFSSPDVTATFECRIDGGDWSACASAHTTAPLADGPHTFEVRAVDSSGNADPVPASRTITVDTAPPHTTIGSGPSGPTADNTPTWAFSSTDAGATFQCLVDSATWAACTSPYTPSALADGTHTFRVRARDTLGNVEQTPATRTVVVDTIAPETTIDSGPSGTIAAATPTFTFSSEAGARFECSLDGAAFAACASPFTTPPLADGAHTFSVRAIDAASNADATPASRGFVISIPPPVLPGANGDSGPLVKILDRRVRLRHGKVVVRIACPAAAAGACRGRAVLSTISRRAAQRRRLGAAAVSVARGRTGRVRIRLSKAAQKSLGAARTIRAKLTVTVTDGPGRLPRKTRAAITIRR